MISGSGLFGGVGSHVESWFKLSGPDFPESSPLRGKRSSKGGRPGEEDLFRAIDA